MGVMSSNIRVADWVQFCARSGPPVQQPPRTGGPVEEASKQSRALIQHIFATTYYVPTSST